MKYDQPGKRVCVQYIYRYILILSLCGHFYFINYIFANKGHDNSSFFLNFNIYFTFFVYLHDKYIYFKTITIIINKIEREVR